MRTVEIPMVSKAVTRVALRPIRSPKCPNRAEPIGRAKNASAKVANDSSVAVVGFAFGKNRVGKTSHRRCGVDIKVEEFDGRADQACEQYPLHGLGRLRGQYG